MSDFLLRYRLCALDERLLLEAHARQVVRISSRPVYVLRELVDLLRRERVVLLGYRILQNMVRDALVFERERLSGVLEGLIGGYLWAVVLIFVPSPAELACMTREQFTKPAPEGALPVHGYAGAT